jgi:PAS domain S-box-containing protein
MTELQVHAERATAEEELRRYRGFFNAGPVVVFRWVAAEGWPVEYVSPNVAQLFGVSSDEFLSGRVPYARTVHPDDLARVAEEVSSHTAARHAGFDQEYRIVRPSGEVRWLFDHTLVVRDAHGVVTHYEGYVLDQTETMRARREREELQRKMLQTQKLESLGVLAGGIAHDFNNLLTAILGNTSLALEDLDPTQRARALLQDALRSVERAADLTREMLAYAGRASLARRPMDLAEHTREIAELLQATLPKKVHLDLDLPSGLPPIDADPAQMQQIVMNLVMNAAEACGEQPGNVRVALSATGANGSGERRSQAWVVLEVRDDGEGMDEATCARIFEPFFTTKAQGRGLGLSAVLGILRAHGGDIEVESTPGAGSRFRVRLPASLRPLVAATVARRSVGPDGGCVLVVDDEESVRRVASRILTSCGFEVLSAPDGRAAVEIFAARTSEIDVVLLDLTMPLMSGDEALEAMRCIRPDVRAVLTSGYSEEEALVRCAERPPAAFLQKPYSVTSLVETLREVMRAHAAAS